MSEHHHHHHHQQQQSGKFYFEDRYLSHRKNSNYKNENFHL
jgi:hypothetical protein